MRVSGAFGRRSTARRSRFEERLKELEEAECDRNSVAALSGKRRDEQISVVRISRHGRRILEWIGRAHVRIVSSKYGRWSIITYRHANNFFFANV